jgi:hypothetical protein
MFQITPADLHPHLQARMRQRGIGITLEEIEQTLNDGWEAADAKPSTFGKVMAFPDAAEWEGHFYPEKEVSVSYKVAAEGSVLLTAEARYGQEFPQR